MPLRNITDTLQLRLCWHKAAEILRSQIFENSFQKICHRPGFIVPGHLYRYEFLKGTGSQIRINYIFKCRTISSFNWICGNFCFFLFSFLHVEKCSIMWNRLYSVKSFGSILRAHCSPRCHIAYLLWGMWRFIVHNFNNQILRNELQTWSMLPCSPFLPSTPAPLITQVFK